MNYFASSLTSANALMVSGLNTGIRLNRVDNAPGGINPHHSYPRTSEVVVPLNIRKGKVLAFTTFNSHLPGVVVVPLNLFTSSILIDLLTKTFQVDANVKKFGIDPSDQGVDPFAGKIHNSQEHAFLSC
ncbi:hypothetical protein F3Y22_tig00112261pilonHSYRG00024 [Hibiscus syriacus]|uniref:Uncharacterized protein n=1 Tax=Hibiscus syriacus TaxID=106335 RepID=A0A6A2YAD8_HIBSY|nr:hypothetical protein F3Y22_tig00112261pilonHSYRG00024 [Hibiscus syriacus]